MSEGNAQLENLAERDSAPWRITGPVSAARPSPLYKLGLGAVALAMVLLPLFYVGLVALVAYAGYHHALNPWYSLGEGWVGLLGYVAPIIIGTILVFFMIKPFFARRSRTTESQRLEPHEEPELFRFVHAICDLLKAPRPHRIELDLRVNASAGFRRGMLDLLGRNLTLTIGVPLVAGLSVTEFGGVLAHEFGHFAQGAGMRLTFIVRNINNWFARVVYERDAWDDRLLNTAKRADVRVGIILHLARGTVWVTRRILWLLMHIGHGISCFMMRQMEFDADQFETKVAGSAAFAATTRRMQLLNIGWQRTLMLQQESFITNRLVDNLPSLVANAASRLPDAVRCDLEQLIATGKTQWFDTHPSDRDRIKASEAIAAAGVLDATGMATTLFRDFAATAREQTRNYYERECGIELKDISLQPWQAMLAEVDTAAEEDRCIEKWFGPLLNVRTRWALKPQQTVSTADASSVDIQEQLFADARPTVDALLKANAEELNALGALALLNAGFIINKKEFGLKDATQEAAQASLADARSRIRKERPRLDEAMKVCVGRFSDALESCRRNGSHTVEIDLLSDLLTRFARLEEVMIRLCNYTSALELLLINSNRATNGSLWNVAAKELSNSIELDTESVLSAFEGYAYPFEHARGKLSLPEFLVESQPHDQPIPRAFFRGRAAFERSSATHYRILARLAVLADTSRASLVDRKE